MMDIIIQYLVFKIDMVREAMILFGLCAGLFLCVTGAHIESYYNHKMVMIILLFIACLFFALGILLPSSDDLSVLLEMRI